MSSKVLVTGMGIVGAVGKEVETFTHSLRQGQSGIGFFEKEEVAPFSVNVGAPIRNFSINEKLELLKTKGLPPDLVIKTLKCAGRSPFAVQVAAGTAMEAWISANLHEKTTHPHRVGIVVGGSNISMNYCYGLFERFQENPEYLNPRYPLHFLDTDYVGTLSEIFTIKGEGFSLGGASASGNSAIIKGFQMIKSGLADVCLVLGAMAHLSPMELQGFYNLGALGGREFADSPDKACRPFDKNHEGFIYGQGCGCLILESEDSSQKRLVPALAEILGGVIVTDGNRLANPNEDGEFRAMKDSLNQAGIEPGDIDYINAHGSSSPLGDETEIRAIHRLFGDRVKKTWINSTKSITGHCLFSAGVVECIATIVQLTGGFVHPNLNLDNPIDPHCRFAGAQAVNTELTSALSNSFGFGGINTSLLLKKGVN